MIIAGVQQLAVKRRRLDQQCIQLVKKGNAEGMVANRRTHHKAYKRFCTEFQFNPFPANNWRQVQFAQFLHNENKRPDTIENYVSSIRVLHRLAGLEPLSTDHIHYKLIRNCFKRECCTPVRQAKPIDHDVLSILFRYVNLNDELETVAWTAVLVGYSLVLRVSNLGPPTRNRFDPLKNLVRGDFVIKKGFPTLGIRWSKTNQYHN